MLTGGQMKAVFREIMEHPAVPEARISYLVGITGAEGRILFMGVWLPRIILHANDNRMRRS